MRALAGQFLLLLALLPAVVTSLDVPYLAGRVTDQAGIIPAEVRQRIEQKLAGFEQQTGNQVAVLTVATLEGEPIEDYAIRVAQTWKLGQKGKDNGVLLLVAHQDRKMRMEVGYGLEPDLTDLETNVIQNEVIIPYFKAGDFGAGIEAGVDAILASLQGQEVEPAPAARQPLGGGGSGGGGWIFSLIGFFTLWPFAREAARSGSWMLFLFLTPFFFFLGLMITPLLGFIAAGAWLVAFPVLRAILPKTPAGQRYRSGGGPWIGGSGWGGGSSGGGGGFSGGGGSFGGGGSSSSW
jgi:uncharacterized protein